MCDSLQEVDASRRRIFGVIHAIGDILIHTQAMSVAMLVDMHCHSELIYQTGSDVIPLL